MSHPSDRELLLWIDREADPQIVLHLNGCSVCRARVAQIEQSLTGLIQLYRSELPRSSSERPREMLEAKLAQSGRLREFATAACAVAAVMLLGFALAFRNPRNAALAFTPNVQLTPGAVGPVSLRDVCSGAFASNDPAVPDTLKRAVFREYGLKDASNDSYELDFLVTPQLGGAVSIRNLWPQPARHAGWNARAKDELEDRLHSLVCSGELDLSTAQRELSQDWVAAYKKYFRTNQPHLAGTRRMRSSVASSTALRENGIG